MELPSPSAEENRMTKKAPTLRSVKTAVSPCAAMWLFPLDVPSAIAFDKPCAAGKLEFYETNRNLKTNFS